MKGLGRAAVLGLLLCGAAAGLAGTAYGTTIKSASGYGPLDTVGFNHCLNQTNPCEAAQLTNQTFNIDGVTGNVVDVTGGSGQFLQVFDLGAVAANTVISLPFLNGGLLTCGFGNGAQSNAVDSSFNTTVAGLPCTPIDDVTGTGTALQNGSTLYSTTDALNNVVTFTINANGSITFDTAVSDVVLWAPSTTATATPEPGSVALLGTGVALLWGKFRRRRSV